MRFDVGESNDVVVSRMNGQAEAMLFEAPPEVRRDSDVQSAPVRARKNVDDRLTCHGGTYYISCEGCLDLARSLHSGLRPSVETTENRRLDLGAKRRAERPCGNDWPLTPPRRLFRLFPSLLHQAVLPPA